MFEIDINGGTWTRDALCAKEDAELFFPEKGQNSRKAKRICERCPVRRECLVDNIEDDYGVWGGLTSQERKRLRRRVGPYSLEDVIDMWFDR